MCLYSTLAFISQISYAISGFSTCWLCNLGKNPKALCLVTKNYDDYNITYITVVARIRLVSITLGWRKGGWKTSISLLEQFVTKTIMELGLSLGVFQSMTMRVIVIKYSKVQLDGSKWTVILFTHNRLKLLQVFKSNSGSLGESHRTCTKQEEFGLN